MLFALRGGASDDFLLELLADLLFFGSDDGAGEGVEDRLRLTYLGFFKIDLGLCSYLSDSSLKSGFIESLLSYFCRFLLFLIDDSDDDRALFFFYLGSAACDELYLCD